MERRYEWRNIAGQLQLFAGDQRMGTIAQDEQEGLACADSVRELEPGIYEWTRVYEIKCEPAGIKLTMDFIADYEAVYWMIPGVSYQGNRWGKGLEPKGYGQEGQPWTYASHRTNVPGATYSEGHSHAVALFGDGSADEHGFSCSLFEKQGTMVHRLIWPEEEGPLVYAARDTYEKAYHGKLQANIGDQVTLKAYLLVEPVTNARTSYSTLLDFAWRTHAHKLKPWHDADHIWDYGIRFVKESLYLRDGKFQGFVWGRYWDGEAWAQKKDAPYEIGWVGQNASLANSLIHDYIRRGNRDSLDMGVNVLDAWAKEAVLPNGLFRVRFNYILGYPMNSPEMLDACNMSAAAMQFIEAFQTLNELGIERPAYMRIAQGICSFTVSAMNEEGRIGKAWDLQGNCLDPEGTVGAFLILPLLQMYKITSDDVLLSAAVKAYRYYMHGFLQDGFTTAGALDTYCIDKESAMPLLKAGLQLYELTADSVYLQYSEMISWYLATWQVHQTIRFPEHSALAAMNYDSFGGTTVSTQHQHIDHYALYFFDEWMKLAEYTNNPQWRERAEAIWMNATAIISDGTLEVTGRVRPVGGQDEGFCHTRWHTSRGDFFGVSQWLVAWPTAFRLEVLRRRADWTIFHGNEEQGQ